MNACDFSVFSKFDLGRCVASIAFAWVPDWVWMVLPYWPWIVIVGGGLMVYRLAGWQGLVLFAGGLGFLAGRRSIESGAAKVSASEPDEIWPPQRGQKAPPGKRVRTIQDMFRRRS